jgi:hypothetical protein
MPAMRSPDHQNQRARTTRRAVPDARFRGTPRGHATIRTTPDRYGHLFDAARLRLRDHLDETYTEAA